MRLTRAQFTVLLFVTVFFTLQFLPHRVTWLVVSPFHLFYPVLVVLVVGAIAFASAIAFVAWIGARNEVPKKYRRNWLFVFVSSLVIFAGVTASNFSCARGLPFGSFVKSFDQTIWALPESSEYVKGDITERQKMLGDVIDRIVVNGTQTQIVARLGPSEENRFSSECDLIYRTGPERDSAFSIDDEWLSIWFDAEGRTARYEVWTD